MYYLHMFIFFAFEMIIQEKDVDETVRNCIWNNLNERKNGKLPLNYVADIKD